MGISDFKNIWDNWNIRLVVLFSLFLQIFLIISAPSRKRTRGFIVLLVWFAYLLADWAARYCTGLITKNEAAKNDFLMAFWGPFLLLHLGGPDTITAFALEDNELWLRHLLGLIFQSLMAAYVFFLTIPRNPLWLPTILMFVAGLIKYAERIHALYVASISNFKRSLLPKPDAGPNYAKLMEEHSSRHEAGLPAKIIMIPELRQRSNNASADGRNIPKADDELELVQTAFLFSQKFQGLIVDMIYSFKDRLESQSCFLNKNAEEALMLLEIELNFMYEIFYTKASVVRQHWYLLCGKFVCLLSILASLVLFIMADMHGFEPWDVRVSYALLYGALVLDVLSLIMRFFTDYTATFSDKSLLDSYSHSCYQQFQTKVFRFLNERFLVDFLKRRKPTWSEIKEGPYKGCEKLSTKFLFRRWCGSISGYNLLEYSLEESIPRVPKNLHRCYYIGHVIQPCCFNIVVCVQDFFYQRDKHSSRYKNLVDQLRYKSTNPFLKELWEYVFDQLKEKSKEAHDIEAIQSICSARGDGVVQKEKLESLKPFVDPNEVAFDQSLLLWHIATALCYTKDVRDEGEKKDKRRFINMLIQEIKNKSRLLWHFTTTLCQAKEDAGVEEIKEQKDGKDKRMKISMLLSDYMLYLLIMQPNLMSVIAGVGQIRFQDTCEEAKRFFRKRISPKWDREAMLKVAC